MLRVTKKEYIVEEKHRFCDLCNHEINNMYTSNTCVKCGIDLCSSCGIEYDESGDYLTLICPTCNSIGYQFNEKIKQLQKQIYQLEENWGMICKTKTYIKPYCVHCINSKVELKGTTNSGGNLYECKTCEKSFVWTNIEND